MSVKPLCTVGGCDIPSKSALVCAKHRGELERALGDVAALVVEAEVTRARLGRSGDNGGRRSAERPLPVDLRAGEVLWVLANTLGGWVRVLEPDPWPADTPSAMAGWLLGHVDALLRHPAAGEAVEEVTAAVEAVRRLIDRAPQRWYAGRCGAPLTLDSDSRPHSAPQARRNPVPGVITPPGCTEDLYATPGAPTVRCRACGAAYDVEQRRAQLLAWLEDTLATRRDILRGLTVLGEAVNENTFRSWTHRQRLFAHGLDSDGRPLYRVGDVLDLAGEAAWRHAGRGQEAAGA